MIILVYIKPNQFWLNCHAPSKDSEWSYICVLSGVGFTPFYDFSVGFWTFLYGVVCFPFHVNHVTISLEYHTHLWHMYTVSCGPPLRFYHFHIISNILIQINKHCLQASYTDKVMNIPFICSNIPAVPAYGVYIFQLIQYSRACGS